MRGGELQAPMRWITRTRLMWQRKRNGKPRPIKMGEVVRTSFAKRCTKRRLPALRARFRAAHQWGVGVPGACEAMAHWRGTVEELAVRGAIPAVVALDVDLVNMFGSVEWDAMRSSIDPAEFPEIAAWTSWHQQEPSVTLLPSGETFTTDRGAEQGDGFGTVQAALTLAAARAPPAGPPIAGDAAALGACEQWFVDDGQ
eukprot:6397320-Alexandrium_andersonii.AAC.1